MKNKDKGLSAWQLAMMALGTVIGGSFFLGSAVAIRAAGPSVVISYILGGILVYFILFSLSEMTVADPAPGSFRTYAGKMFGPGTGFVVGWVYWTGIVLAMSSEATAVSFLLREWFPGISIALVGSLIIILVTMLNLLGADRLSKLESGLAAIKILAIVSFILLGLFMIIGLIPGVPPVGAGELSHELWLPGGVKSIAGSMLIVIFTYAGFEIIGLAASEAGNPHRTIPKAIAYTVLSLVGLYIVSVVILLPLIPTGELTEEISPMVAALNRWGIGWAGSVINTVLVTAILSTMLAAMFGLGRMIRSLADEGDAPGWLRDKGDVPYKGIIFSGFSMLLGLALGFLLPHRVYIFLISSGGFALLFTYAIILATHIRFRKKYGCPPNGKCQMPWYPYSSWASLCSIIIVIISMPLISGQESGLIAGITIVVMYWIIYSFKKVNIKSKPSTTSENFGISYKTNSRRAGLSSEFSEELSGERNDIRKQD